MDRVNPSTVFKPAFFTLPALLVIASLCQADDPGTQRVAEKSGIQQAVGVVESEPGVIRQVVGKQPQPRRTRPGLLEVLAGSKPKGDTHHHHENMPKGESQGLLDVLFNSDSKAVSSKKKASKSTSKSTSKPTSKSTSTRGAGKSGGHAKKDVSLSVKVSGAGLGISLSKNQSKNSAQPRSSGKVSQKPNSVNWDGIPYHSASAVRQSTKPQPIRDPEAGSSPEDTGVRIIRGGSRTMPAKTVSSRHASQSNSGGAAISTLAVPQPPHDIKPIPAPVSNFSNTSSSRRSSRRTVEPLKQSTSKAATVSLPKKAASQPEENPGEVDDLVPHVSRKNVPDKIAETEASENEETPAVVAAQTAPVSSKQQAVPGEPQAVPRKRFVAPRQVPSQEIAIRPSGLPRSAETAESRTAVAAIGAPLTGTPSDPANHTVDPAIPRVPVVTAQPKIVDSPQTANLPKIASQPAATHARFPQPVLAPQEDLTQPAYTTPAEPSAPTITALPAATASHRSGPPSSAFGSAEVDSTDSSFSPASAPVGSGVAPVDPYALKSDNDIGTAKLPIPTAGLRSAFPAQPNEALSADSDFAPNPNRIADNSSASAGGRNSMRTTERKAGVTGSTSELPGIRVATYGPSEVMIRQVNEYEIRVENRGAIDAMGVIVRAAIPTWADMKGKNATNGNVKAESQGKVEHLVWTIDRLPAGASEKMFIRLIAARSGSYGLDVDWTMAPQKSVAKVRVHEPRLKLTIEGPDQVVYGMSQTYRVRVLNPGDGTAPNVVFTLSPDSTTPQTQRIGDIPPGKEAQFDVELTAQDLGDLKIHGLASGDLELRSESSKTIRVAAANLEAVLSGPQLKYQNTEAMYGLQLQNNGAAACNHVTATLRLPSGVRYLGGIDGAVAQGNLLRWKLDSLDPGAMRNYQFRCQMASTGDHVFAFECLGSAAGSTDVSIATRVESIADLVLTVADPPAPASIGSDVTYEILIRNRGSKEATNVRAVAQFGHGIEPQRIEGHSGEVVPGQVMFDAIPRIGPGAEVRLRVIAQAEKVGHHRFRAEVHSGDTMLVAEEATHYMNSQSDRVSRRSNEAGSR